MISPDEPVTLRFITRELSELTAWCVFEPNDDATRRRLEAVVAGWLDELWRSGHLLGATSREAYSVRVDGTDVDLALGRYTLTAAINLRTGGRRDIRMVVPGHSG